MFFKTFLKRWDVSIARDYHWDGVRTTGGRTVGQFDPDAVVFWLRTDFGNLFECDGINQMVGHGDRRAAMAESIGIPRDSPAVLTEYRREKELSPTYAFRIRIGPSSVSGRVSPARIRFEWDVDTEMPEQFSELIESFLSSLHFGEMKVDRVHS